MGIIIGSTIGSFVPALWGGDPLSASSILFSGLGGFAGIYFGYKMSKL